MKTTTIGTFGRAAQCLCAAALTATIAAPVALRARHAHVDVRDQDGARADDRQGTRGDDGRFGRTDPPFLHLVVIFQENV